MCQATSIDLFKSVPGTGNAEPHHFHAAQATDKNLGGIAVAPAPTGAAPCHGSGSATLNMMCTVMLVSP
jgi:hypothetical protein